MNENTLKDHQGNLTATIHGSTVERLSYDAWGNLRDPDTWIGETANQLMFDRGYTGHEHLPYFGLINMNGRCYDPVMSSFLSVDAFVQSPDNSQSFNRYAYCMNNPLKYTDPSGWVMLGGMTPNNPFHDNWGQNFGEKIYTATEVRQMLWTTDISIGIWMVGNEMHGGCSNSGDSGGSEGWGDYCNFGYGNPNAVGLKGPGACVFASLGEICARLGKSSKDPKFWEDKEKEYYKMKNADGEENENNHGYNTDNLVDFVQWVANIENVELVIKQIAFESIYQACIDGSQVLVSSSVYDYDLIIHNGGECGHAAVVNSYRLKNNGSVVMTFGDPSPIPIMPARYENQYGSPPEGFSGWGFYQINIYRP